MGKEGSWQERARNTIKLNKIMPMGTKEEQRAFQRNWMRQRRLEFFKDKCCVKCGSVENLNLDHIDPATKVTHNIWSWKKERREAEISKCQVLCFNCHAEKSAAYRIERAKGSKRDRDRLAARLEKFGRSLSDFSEGAIKGMIFKSDSKFKAKIVA